MKKFTSPIIGFIRIAGFMVLFSACNSNVLLKPVNSKYYLSTKQIGEYSVAAMHGDDAAALRLYDYDNYIALDNNGAVKWLSFAASNNVAAQYLLGDYYSGDYSLSFKDANKALYWYNRAACGGNTNAIDKLKELNRSPDCGNR